MVTEMDMEEEEEMEMEFVVFEAREVDLDYEFDAAMYFDFSRPESIAEAREAERWFDTALSYPPSPFVAKLVLREDSILENIITSPASKDEENRATLIKDGYSDDMVPEFSAIEVDNGVYQGTYKGTFTNLRSGNLHKVSNQPVELTTGLTFYHHTFTDKSKPKAKSTAKSNFPRSSTLMKPTASMLAKQNQPPQVHGSRFQTLLGHKERSLYNTPAVESHSAKRQKLEGGHLRKIGDAKQQTDFIHKAPRKDGIVDKISAHPKLRLTVPREPELETTHRAQRIRPKDSTEQKQMTLPARRFKARPLNRKILEAPSLPLPKKSTPKLPEFQEFHLKTLERAMQHTSSVSSCNDSDKGMDKPSAISVVESGKTESRRAITSDPPKLDGCSTAHVFRARPLNKKIFSSKGEIGVFRNSKRETTVPMEFNFHTEKRVHHNPPIELFSKLSLASELQSNNRSQFQFSLPGCISMKGSKENRVNPLQTEQQMAHLVKERPSMFGGKQQIQYRSKMGSTEVGNQLNMRSFGIR